VISITRSNKSFKTHKVGIKRNKCEELEWSRLGSVLLLLLLQGLLHLWVMIVLLTYTPEMHHDHPGGRWGGAPPPPPRPPLHPARIRSDLIWSDPDTLPSMGKQGNKQTNKQTNNNEALCWTTVGHEPTQHFLFCTESAWLQTSTDWLSIITIIIIIDNMYYYYYK